MASLIKRAEKAGRRVTSITTPDGTTIRFADPEPSDATNPWLAVRATLCAVDQDAVNLALVGM
jgi:hypothetical protein